MMEKQISCNMLVESVAQGDTITTLLSKFSCIKITGCSYQYTTALEGFFRNKPTMMFVDLKFADFTNLVHNNAIFIGICDKKQMRSLKKYLDMGFRRFIEKPIEEKDFLNVIGNILNDYCVFLLSNTERKYNTMVSESSTYYNIPVEKTTFLKDSIFLNGNRKSESLRIMLDDIIYVQLTDQKIEMHFENGSIKTMNTSLKYFQNRLPKEKFQKINRKTIINIDKIVKVVKNNIILEGNLEFQASRIFKKNVKQLFS